MPETTQLELRTDSVEQIIDLLEILETANIQQTMPRERRRAVADRLRRNIKEPEPDAIGLCGLPGAGKSHVAEKLGKVYDAPVVSMGDAIREKFYLEHDREYEDGEELGAFAAEWREEAAEEIPQFVTEIADRHDAELVIIDGVRSTTDYEVLSEFFEQFYLLRSKAKFADRLERLQDRGREGEAEFTVNDLHERDDREYVELGFGELARGDYIDIEFRNDEDDELLTLILSDIVENNLPFEIQNGTPLGLDEDMEAYRRGEISREELLERQSGPSEIV
jgi:dephospho-CoA kinase